MPQNVLMAPPWYESDSSSAQCFVDGQQETLLARALTQQRVDETKHRANVSKTNMCKAIQERRAVRNAQYRPGPGGSRAEVQDSWQLPRKEKERQYEDMPVPLVDWIQACLDEDVELVRVQSQSDGLIWHSMGGPLHQLGGLPLIPPFHIERLGRFLQLAQE